MNIDDLRNDWQNDTSYKNITENDLARKAQHPLNKLKETMKLEYFMQILCILVSGFAPVFLSNINTQIILIYYAFYFLLVFVSMYYLKGFYNFYYDIKSLETNSQQNLYKLYYELRLQIERYKSFGFLLLPLIWGYLFFIFNSSISLSFHTYKMPILLVCVFITTFIYIIMIVYWVEYIYGKYAKQLLKVLEEFEQ